MNVGRGAWDHVATVVAGDIEAAGEKARYDMKDGYFLHQARGDLPVAQDYDILNVVMVYLNPDGYNVPCNVDTARQRDCLTM